MQETNTLTYVDLKSLKKAFLISVYESAHVKREEALSHIDELEELCSTYGLETVAKWACPIRAYDSGTCLGSGKLEELKAEVLAVEAEVVIFDDEITPRQQRNLEKIFKRPVIDRTELIIEVFAQRAQTKEAQLQIELAKVRYEFPRLRRMWTHLSRQAGTGSSGGGGAYLKGEGEKQIEIDRRLLKKRITRLNDEIKQVISHRETQRRKRERTGIPTFAIVGYTNAGKSTLLNALTEAEVLVENKLFATLDTTTRKFVLPNHQEVLLIDTVGFIRKIPHTLVAAFKSTLEEAVHTDILIHLIDVSHPAAEEHAEETMKVLEELGANQPVIIVLNKVDLVEHRFLITKFRVKYPKVVAISAKEQTGFDELLEMMVEQISNLRKVVHCRIPQEHYALVAEIMKEGRVIDSEYEENDVLLHIEIPSRLEHKVQSFLIN